MTCYWLCNILMCGSFDAACILTSDHIRSYHISVYICCITSRLSAQQAIYRLFLWTPATSAHIIYTKIRADNGHQLSSSSSSSTAYFSVRVFWDVARNFESISARHATPQKNRSHFPALLSLLLYRKYEEGPFIFKLKRKKSLYLRTKWYVLHKQQQQYSEIYQHINTGQYVTRYSYIYCLYSISSTSICP